MLLISGDCTDGNKEESTCWISGYRVGNLPLSSSASLIFDPEDGRYMSDRGEATQKAVLFKVAKTSVPLANDFAPMVRRGKANKQLCGSRTDKFNNRVKPGYNGPIFN
jgi:hypothetical protein